MAGTAGRRGTRPDVMTEFVAIDEHNFEDLFVVGSAGFGEDPREDMLADERRIVEYDRMIGVSDGGSLVGSAGAYSFGLTVPGGAELRAAGVTWVAVLPTHRRQGLLRSMMTHLLDDVVARGEPIAVLTASEATIYGRFGFGVGAQFVRAKVTTADAAFASDATATGSLRLAFAGDEAAVQEMAAVYEQWRHRQHGALSRPAGYWENVRVDAEHRREGKTRCSYLLHRDASGATDGYAYYRVKTGDDDHDNLTYVNEVIAPDPVV